MFFWFIENVLYIRVYLIPAWKTYDGMKLGLMLYLFLPAYRGAERLYKVHLREHLDPYLEQYGRGEGGANRRSRTSITTTTVNLNSVETQRAAETSSAAPHTKKGILSNAHMTPAELIGHLI